jgi:hypothetical protein
MNGLVILIGETFRKGGQNSRNRGSPEAYDGQIEACNSHIRFIEHTCSKYKLNSFSVYIASYNTQYNNNLLSVYKKYLIGHIFYENVIGINTLFHNSFNNIENKENYDFILFIRIDLFLKQYFTDVFNPTINKILLPSICWYRDCRYNNIPRVNSILVYVPKKYYKYIKNISFYHDLWLKIINSTDLTVEDLDVMINTYHDSDSEKDYNPLYYIVNRNQCEIFHSEDYIFDKYKFV